MRQSPHHSKNLEALGDEALVSLVKESDPFAFDELVFRYSSYIYYRVRRLSCRKSDEEDWAQEGLIGLLKAVRSYEKEKGASFKTYATVCIDRRLFDLRAAELGNNDVLKEELEEEEAPDCYNQENNPQAIFEDREHLQNITQQLQDLLSVFEQRTLDLYLAGYSYQEMARRLRKTPKAVDNALQRVRRKLRFLKQENLA